MSYVGRGYWFYVAGCVPEGKDPLKVDRKLVEKYGVDRTKWERARRKMAGLANLQYIRFGDRFLLLATQGEHSFFAEERVNIRDARRVPIQFAGYSISYRDGHPHVRIAREVYNLTKAFLLEQAPRNPVQVMDHAFQAMPFEAYAPVRRQVLNLHRAVNRVRKTAGLPEVPMEAVRLRRRVVRVFD